MYEVIVVHGAGKGKVIWSEPVIIVMIGLGRKKSMQYVLLEAKEAELVLIIVCLRPTREIYREISYKQNDQHMTFRLVIDRPRRISQQNQ